MNEKKELEYLLQKRKQEIFIEMERLVAELQVIQEILKSSKTQKEREE
jgi:hypothetical protein